MNEKHVGHFRELLYERRAELLGYGKETVADMLNEKATFPDPTDRAFLESNRNFTLRMRDRERKLLLKIQEALIRLNDGTFGICEDCDEDIPLKRLEARPTTTFCVECKTKSEELEKKTKC